MKSKPAILAVDDEPAVLSAVVRDLRRKYGADYRILRAASGAAALEALQQLHATGEPVALLLVDQRMPSMTGVEFISRAIELYPDVKRVLLTAYSDTEAAIRAINEVRLDHYLLKPWEPPEERLYPVLTDLLDDWLANFQPPYQGLRVFGFAWSAEGHRIRDYLTRNMIPFRWHDVGSEDDGVAGLDAEALDAASLPAVLLPDGSQLVKPSNQEIGRAIGFHVEPHSEVYDLIIVGAGPAGLACAVYGASEGLRTLLIEREAPGGQAAMSSRIENYLGFPVGLSGTDLARRAVAQASRLGAEILAPAEATRVAMNGEYPVVTLKDGTELGGRALVIATGVTYRMLDVPGASGLSGAGVYYGAAVTEAATVRGKDVFVVGGGNSAGQAAMYLSRFASSVTILVRAEDLTKSMSHYLVTQIGDTPNISVRGHTTVARVIGERSIEAIEISDNRTHEVTQHPAAALFVFIGARPRSDWLGDLVVRDRQGFVMTGPALMPGGQRPQGWPLSRDPFWLETSVPGVFAAGDVRHRSIKRVASAVGEGSMTVQFIHQHLTGSLLAPPAAVRRK